MFRPLGGHRQAFQVHTIKIIVANSFTMAVLRSQLLGGEVYRFNPLAPEFFFF